MSEEQAYEILQYLNVDPLRDYWFGDVERMVWCVHRSNGDYEERPIRWRDLTRKGKKEHPELNPKNLDK